MENYQPLPEGKIPVDAYPNRRKRVLTDDDVLAIAEILRAHPNNCQMGLTTDDVSVLKRFLSAWDKATNIIGSAILTALVVALIAVFTRGFWAELASGIRGIK